MAKWRHGPRKARPTWQLLWSCDPFCWLCDGFVEARDASVDHLIPLSKGGLDEIPNTGLAHRTCNSERGNPDPTPEIYRFVYERRAWGPVLPLPWLAPESDGIIAAIAIT